MKTKNLLHNCAVTLCASAFFLGSVSHIYADKGGKGGGKTEKKEKSDKGKSDKGSDKKDHDKKSDHKKDHGDKLDKKFDDKDDFYSFYKGKGKDGLPPGLAKKVRNGGDLPPGWKNKVTKGWKIDDDYWKKLDLLDAADLPKDYKLKDGVGAYILGDRILKVDKDTKTVIDFVDLVLD